MNVGFTYVPFPILLGDLSVILKQSAVNTKRIAISLILYKKGNQCTEGLRTQGKHVPGAAEPNAQGCAFVRPIFGLIVNKMIFCAPKILASVINCASNLEHITSPLKSIASP